VCSVKAHRLPRIVDSSINTDIFLSTLSFDTTGFQILIQYV
jgi:hypothetical protein